MPRKDSIILTAIEIIDELGIHELSTRELANRQGVSEPALYRHFRSKQDIILAVIDHFSKFDSMIVETIKERKLNSREGIRFFMSSFYEYYENYPALTAIIFAYDILRYDPVIGERIKSILDARYSALNHVIKNGQQNGEISKTFISEDLSDTILGLGRSITLRWRMTNCGFPLKQRVMLALESLLAVC